MKILKMQISRRWHFQTCTRPRFKGQEGLAHKSSSSIFQGKTSKTHRFGCLWNKRIFFPNQITTLRDTHSQKRQLRMHFKITYDFVIFDPGKANFPKRSNPGKNTSFSWDPKTKKSTRPRSPSRVLVFFGVRPQIPEIRHPWQQPKPAIFRGKISNARVKNFSQKLAWGFHLHNAGTGLRYILLVFPQTPFLDSTNFLSFSHSLCVKPL